MTDAHARKHEMETAFRSAFGGDAEIWVRAPGRVELMGSHTDYNACCVLTHSIDRDTWIAARPRDDGRVRLRSLNVEGEHEFAATARNGGAQCQGWALYVQGVAMMLEEAGHPISGADLLVHGTVPLASGLSSSASLEVATATAFEQLGGFALGGIAKARLCQAAENRVVGVNCGLLDQYSSAMGEDGSALLLDCRDDSHTLVGYPEGLRTVVCDTGASRRLTASGYDQRRAECEQAARFFAGVDPSCRTLRDVSLPLLERYERELDPVLARRARFIVEEQARVLALARAFAANDRAAISRWTAESYEGARSLFEICVPAMDAMIEAVGESPGLVGARQTGAGFGGCTVALVEGERVEAFTAEAAARYHRATGTRPAIYAVQPSPGAGAVSELL